MSLKSIGTILQTSHQPFTKGVNAAMVVELANKILTELFGSAVLEHAQASYLKNRVLTVSCLNPIIAQEIKLHEQVLLSQLQKKTGSKMIEKIAYSL